MPISVPRTHPALKPILALLAAAALLLAFEAGRHGAREQLTENVTVAAQARLQAFEATLATQRAVAATLADDGLARRALQNPTSETPHQVSLKLERLLKETGSTIIYLLDRNGKTISSSNWNEPISFVGGDYAFRDYFINAVKEGQAIEAALGKDSLRPGLYLSHDLREGDDLLGVIVVKMEFEAMEQVWARSADKSFVTTAANQVALGAFNGPRFGPPPDVGDKLAIKLPVKGAEGWHLTLATSSAPILQAGLTTMGIMALIELSIVAMLWRIGQLKRRARQKALAERDYRKELEKAVEDRTRALTAEMVERHQAEEQLSRMQGELVQANKLATLGQITAGLAHEVNQPLATIRLLADNGLALWDIAPEEVRANLVKIAGMTDRISSITNNLRGFARKATGQTTPVSVREALQASILLTASRRKLQVARLVIQGDSPSIFVQAEAVRLEQVLVNLIQNAHEAQIGQPNAEIRVRIIAHSETVDISVSDNGPGLSPETFRQLFIPFATSKSEGLGLGLVIAQGIARDLGGDLIAAPPAPNQGATFTLTLPRAAK